VKVKELKIKSKFDVQVICKSRQVQAVHHARSTEDKEGRRSHTELGKDDTSASEYVELGHGDQDTVRRLREG
jgi:hypothetical protein